MNKKINLKNKLFIISLAAIIIFNSVQVMAYSQKATIESKDESYKPSSMMGSNPVSISFIWRAFKILRYTLVFVDARGSKSTEGPIVQYKWGRDSWSLKEGGPAGLFFFKDLKMHKIMLEVRDSKNNMAQIQHVVFAPRNDKGGRFSGTYITEYDFEFLGWELSDLPENIIRGQYSEVYNILRQTRWSQNFLKTNGQVTESTFKSDIKYSDFHYHCGHGFYDFLFDATTELALKNWNINPLDHDSGDITPSDINGKWTDSIKWVWLHSCHMLEDNNAGGHENKFRDQWASAALYPCHMVLGFATITYPSIDVVSNFFIRAMDDKLNIVQAYKLATKDALGSSQKGALIVDTQNQYNNDHLIGQGTVCDSSGHQNGVYYWETWWC